MAAVKKEDVETLSYQTICVNQTLRSIKQCHNAISSEKYDKSISNDFDGHRQKIEVGYLALSCINDTNFLSGIFKLILYYTTNVNHEFTQSDGPKVTRLQPYQDPFL